MPNTQHVLTKGVHSCTRNDPSPVLHAPCSHRTLTMPRPPQCALCWTTTSTQQVSSVSSSTIGRTWAGVAAKQVHPWREFMYANALVCLVRSSCVCHKPADKQSGHAAATPVAGSLLSPQLAQFQGPALLAYNDGVFTEKVCVMQLPNSTCQSSSRPHAALHRNPDADSSSCASVAAALSTVGASKLEGGRH